MILPLPVIKNKFGENVADISTEKFYRQITEEVLEAHEEDWLYAGALDDIENPPAEELVDIITCCITRLDIIEYYNDEKKFSDFLGRIVACTENPSDAFYTELSAAVMGGYCSAKTVDVFDWIFEEGQKGHIKNIPIIPFEVFTEKGVLANIIAMCITRLHILGYDESARQNLYLAVNEKNRKCGYFDD